MAESEYIIEMRNITKEFPGIVANDDITLQLKKGEIHALLGENGAGKSTLMSVLFGLYQAEKGQIYKNGEPVTIRDPNDATKLGIGMVHQHFKLVECFTVLENIILGAEDTKFGFVSKKEARKKAEFLMEKYGLYVDLDATVEDITVGMQQRTEILKMLFRDNEILIFDEPTAVLTPQEIEALMATMKSLKAEGKTILFISHKLNEIMEVSDVCTVLRKGKSIGSVKTSETTVEQLSTMMVGRDIEFDIKKEKACPKEEVIRTENLCFVNKESKKGSLTNINIHVNAGEIVCIAGIDGNGQREFVHCVSGLSKISSGKLFISCEDVTNKNIRDRINKGISHIPEDRRKHGLILDFTLQENMVLERYFEPQFNKHGFIKFEEVTKYSDTIVDAYDVRCGQGSLSLARSMSGGNQQKAVVGRELIKPHKLLLACQLTRGLDVGAIEYIHKQVIKKRDEGDAVLLVSFELDEVMKIADRIYVMFEGEIVGEFNPKDITVQELGLYMAGAKRM